MNVSLDGLDRDRRRADRTLFVGAAIGSTGVVAALSVASLAGETTSGGTTWSGLPGAVTIAGAAVGSTLVARWLDASRGRRSALSRGYAIGILGAAVAAWAVASGLFLPLLVGSLLVGVGQAATHLTRYVVADLHTVERRASAIGWIVWAGTIGAVAGPALLEPTGAAATRLGLNELVGPYLAAAVALALIPAWYALRLRPDPSALAVAEAPDLDAPISEIAAPDARLLTLAPVRTALLVMVTGQAVMVIVMSMTPVHIRHGGHDLGVVGLIMSAHILGMYAFAPAVGKLVDRIGPHLVAMAGIAMLAAASLLAATAPAGGMAFGAALWLLGVGWSFGFVAGSGLLARSLPAAIRTRIQGQVETVVWLASASASLSAGLLLSTIGFVGLCWLGAGLTAAPAAALARSLRRVRLQPS